ncbi:MAG: conjugal transfer protein TraD [Caulobacteraceae bacterium]
MSMRTPRNIDAELKALADKAKGLKAKRLVQLGELVTITGADALDLETLAGALIAVAADAKNAEKLEAWRHDGAAFFQRRRRKAKDASSGNPGDLEGDLTQQSGDPQS